MTKITECKAYLFCKENVDKDTTPKYVKAQMTDFIRISAMQYFKNTNNAKRS